MLSKQADIEHEIKIVLVYNILLIAKFEKIWSDILKVKLQE